VSLSDVDVIVEAVRSGHTRTAARLLRALDDDDPAARPIVAALAKTGSNAHVLGITGPAGAGKSTLVSALIRHIRSAGQTVAVLAVDPSSTRTGGALLGDRVRMVDHADDAGVFIRSVASRGELGGVGRSTLAMVVVLQAMGFDRVIIETVGVGQSEVDVARIADTTCVVVMPGAGDDVQAMKAGLFEEADLFVVNKHDLPGAGKTTAQLRGALRLTRRDDGWQRPVLRTSATADDGIDTLLAAIDRHAAVQTSRGAPAGRVSSLIVEQARRWCATVLAGWLRDMGSDDDLAGRYMAGALDLEDVLRVILKADDTP